MKNPKKMESIGFIGWFLSVTFITLSVLVGMLLSDLIHEEQQSFSPPENKISVDFPPEDNGITGETIVYGVYIHTEPNANSNVIKLMSTYETFGIVGKDETGQWLKLTGSQEAWLDATLVELHNGKTIEDLPVANTEK